MTWDPTNRPEDDSTGSMAPFGQFTSEDATDQAEPADAVGQAGATSAPHSAPTRPGGQPGSAPSSDQPWQHQPASAPPNSPFPQAGANQPFGYGRPAPHEGQGGPGPYGSPAHTGQPYGQPAAHPYGAPQPYAGSAPQPGQQPYGQPATQPEQQPSGQPATQDRPTPYGQPADYGAPGAYGRQDAGHQGPYGEQGGYGPPGPYSQPGGYGRQNPAQQPYGVDPQAGGYGAVNQPGQYYGAPGPALPGQQPEKKSTGLVIALVLIALLVIGGAIIGALLLGDDADPEAGVNVNDVTEPTGIYDTDLGVGMCLESLDYNADQQLTVLPCSDPHTVEVIAETTLDDADYPGDDAVEDEADSYCTSAAGDVVGDQPIERAELRVLYPTQSTWDAGDRLVSCLARAEPGVTFTGSIVAGDAEER